MTAKVPRKIRDVVCRFKAALAEAGFSRVRVFVFGSYARNEARPDSDIDICLVSSVFKGNTERYRKKAVFIAFKIDPRIQVVVAEPEKFKSDVLSPLFSSIRKEAIAA